MSETKFTKGPWVVNDGFKSNFLRGKITAEIKNNDVVIVDTPSFYFGQAVAVANANLIACAPDMYEMLEKIKIQMECCHGVNTNEIESLLKRARGEHE